MSKSTSPSYQGIYVPGAAGNSPTLRGLRSSDRVRTHGEQLVVVVADNSGSMSGAKSVEANAAIGALARQLADPANKDGFRVSVVTFADRENLVASAQTPTEAATLTPLTGDGGGTNLAPGLRLGLRDIQGFSRRPDRRLYPPIVVAFSDGCVHDDEESLREKLALQAAGATIVAVGFGEDADERFLQSLATSSGHYAFADVGQLGRLFEQVGKTMSVSMQLQAA